MQDHLVNIGNTALGLARDVAVAVVPWLSPLKRALIRAAMAGGADRFRPEAVNWSKDLNGRDWPIPVWQVSGNTVRQAAIRGFDRPGRY